MAARLIFVGFGLFAHGAAAETVWLHPDRDPFQGTLDDALDLFAAQGIPRQVLNEERRLYLSGRCMRRRIGDGERIALMTFGANRVLAAVVAATRLWPDWAPRGALVCRAASVRGAGYALLRPDVCGNWSEEKLPSPPASPALPADVDEPYAIPGIPPAAAGLSDAADGSEALLQPVGFFLPALLPGAAAQDFAPGPVLPDSSGLPISPGLLITPDSPGPPPARVPEPASGFLFGSALVVLVLVRACRRQKSV